MSNKPYPPAPQHLRAACAHPDGHLTGRVSRATLQTYLDDGLVYRSDGDGFRLPPDTAQDQGAGPYVITGAGRRAILNDSQRTAVDSADDSGALGPKIGWPTADALARLRLVEYRDAGGNTQPTDGDDGRTGPRHRPYLTPAGIDAARAAPLPT
ncbi:hypothetical protein OG800_49510 (plasmid) [Streptomyces sp. NBC_00445]|uniref:hypothetical protein n=1 Tax=Streptomyces sp. NBC_00445 TaxID=2975745 RepID=UPI002E207A5B